MSCCCPNKILTYRITQFWASILNMVLCCPPPNNLPIAWKRTAESPYLAFPLSLSLQAAAQFQLISAKSSGFWVILLLPLKFLNWDGCPTEPGWPPPLYISRARDGVFLDSEHQELKVHTPPVLAVWVTKQELPEHPPATSVAAAVAAGNCPCRQQS